MNIQYIDIPKRQYGRHSQSSLKKRTVFCQIKSRKCSDRILDTVDDQQSYSIERIVEQATLLMLQKRWQALRQCCNVGLNIQDDPDLYNMKGRAQGKLGNLELKIQLTKKAIQLNPRCPIYYRSLGSAYYKLQKYEQAFESHKKCLQLQPNNSINYHNIGTVLFRLKRYNDAIKYFNQSIQLDKYEPQSHRWMGNLYKEIGNLKQALFYYEKAYDLGEKEIDRIQIQRLQKLINPWKVFFNNLLFC